MLYQFTATADSSSGVFVCMLSLKCCECDVGTDQTSTRRDVFASARGDVEALEGWGRDDPTPCIGGGEGELRPGPGNDSEVVDEIHSAALSGWVVTAAVNERPRLAEDRRPADSGLWTERGHPRSGQGHPRSGWGHPRTEPGHPRSERGHPRSGRGHPRTEPGHPRSERGHFRSGQGPRVTSGSASVTPGPVRVTSGNVLWRCYSVVLLMLVHCKCSHSALT